ncbi:Cation efflux system protein, heavy metal resistance (plasmid) [Cupriavidus taiwanensis]|uniref:Cation efflux system protein, heavy metal resistance n=1 Tax=Cupriavidus taiwanensis TaxID=164546 RepID=A0A375IPK5_9BURK|nr:efflux RND transporter periplasmic adaptor subunit [Cupriavidus taiwanensis]SPK76554.1 Cation efflux system protein, heavy metal resistance [Cupriavidus taiwanensis]
MAMSKQQRAAVVAILVAGLLGGAAILLTGKGGGAGGEAAHGHAGHGDEHGHEHGEEGGKAETKAGAHADASAPAVRPQAEGKPHVIALTPAQIEQAGIGMATAAAAALRSSVDFPGEIRFNDDRTAHVVPRVAGVAQAVPANLGQPVRKGEVLALIASTSVAEQRSELLAAQKREALARATYAREKTLWQEKISAEQDYQQARTALEEAQIAVQNARQKLTAIGAAERGGAGGALNQFALRAPFDGIVVEKHLALGEAVKEDASVFTVSDLSSVWAEFVVSARDLDRVRVGEAVTVRSSASATQAEGKVSYVGALLGEQTRTAKARVTLANPGMAWRPGLFVTVSVRGAPEQVPVTVAADAVQQVDGQSVVFVAVPDGFAVQPVQTGRSDGKLVEVARGLQAGARYAAANSFILKSELGKASAGHEH